MKKLILFCCVCTTFAPSYLKTNAQSMQENIQAPKAKEIPKTLKKHKEIRIDNYFWLNDRENPEVIDYLNKENEYYQQMTVHTKGFQESLYEEMKGRIKEDDSSVPYFLSLIHI